MKFLIWIITCVLCALSCIYREQYVLSWTLWTIAICLTLLNLYLFFIEEDKPKQSTTDQVLARIQRESAAKAQIRDERARANAQPKPSPGTVAAKSTYVPITDLTNYRLLGFYGTTNVYSKDEMLNEMKNRGFNHLSDLQKAIPSYYGSFQDLSLYKNYLKF